MAQHFSSSSQTSLRVVLNRISEPCLAHYGASRTPLDSPQVAFEFWRDVVATDPAFEPDKEHLIAVILDTKLRPKGYHVVSVGSVNETIAQPRETFRAAIIAAAYGILIMHNHPSGDPAPSQADHRMTRQMREAAGIIGIQLLDHVVIGEPGEGRQPFFSFRDGGVL